MPDHLRKAASTLASASKGAYRRAAAPAKWLRRALTLAFLAYTLDHYWLSQQPWYADIPMSGYAFQQKLLQETFLDRGEQSRVIIFDVSQALPATSALAGNDLDLRSDLSADRAENLELLGMLVKDIASYSPTAIAIDWSIAPSASERVGGRFPDYQLSLFKAIEAVRSKGIPVVFGADLARDRPAGSRLPVASPESGAATLSIPEPLLGPYHAGGQVEAADWLPPLAVLAAQSATGDKSALWTKGSLPGIPTILPAPDPADPATFWINYEAVPAMIKESFELSALNGDMPFISSSVVGEQLRGRVVLIGDLRTRAPEDTATIPLTGRCFTSPGQFVGAAFEHSNDLDATVRKTLRNQMAITSTAGALHQASAIHTLMGNPLRSFSSGWAGVAFSTLWSLLWALVSTVGAMALVRLLRLEKGTPFSEIHVMVLDVLVASAASATSLLWLAGQTHIHGVLLPLAAAMVVALVFETATNMCVTVYEVRREAAHHAKTDQRPSSPS